VELSIMDSRTGKRRAMVLLVLTLAVLVAAVLVTGRFHLRLDLTRDGAYTLAKVSRELYKELPEQVRITYYLSRTLSDKHPGPRAIEDFLRELEAASRGRISVTVTDPTAGKGEAAGAVEALGISPQQMQIVEKNEQRVALVYSGILVQYLDRTQVLPFAIDVENLEYDVVKAVRAALGNKKPVAAVLVGDQNKVLANEFQTLAGVLERSGWQIRSIAPGEAVPPETGVLLVIGNSGLDDYDVYRIDSYLASGG
jgi:ABC-type uncharacterized transport system involved in gliding motility auxiliary subunit